MKNWRIFSAEGYRRTGKRIGEFKNENGVKGEKSLLKKKLTIKGKNDQLQESLKQNQISRTNSKSKS